MSSVRARVRLAGAALTISKAPASGGPSLTRDRCAASRGPSYSRPRPRRIGSVRGQNVRAGKIHRRTVRTQGSFEFIIHGAPESVGPGRRGRVNGHANDVTLPVPSSVLIGQRLFSSTLAPEVVSAVSDRRHCRDK